MLGVCARTRVLHVTREGERERERARKRDREREREREREQLILPFDTYVEAKPRWASGLILNPPLTRVGGGRSNGRHT
jgi:hypothetical protein